MHDDKQPSEFWVFGYGSLIWKPGFDCAERRVARLDGYQRRFALTSEYYRGTPERPGLVLGLDRVPGTSCVGVALRAHPEEERRVRDYLADRELVSYAYFETLYPVTLLDDGPGQGETRNAICYVLDRSHPQYVGPMPEEKQADIISEAVGPAGPNADYLMNTLDQLNALGIADTHLEHVAQLVRDRKNREPRQ
ncbi:MAG: gamma-glutamylcyclotransferase [Pseudomonadota bacterium]